MARDLPIRELQQNWAHPIQRLLRLLEVLPNLCGFLGVREASQQLREGSNWRGCS